MEKKFDKDFKIETVKLVLDSKRPVAAVAREVGIHENTLYNWVKLFREYQEDAFPGSGNLRPEEAEIRHLRISGGEDVPSIKSIAKRLLCLADAAGE